MWIELGIPRPGTVQNPVQRTWVNLDHVARVEFLQEGGKLTATVITTKPGGSDRSIFQGDDAERLKLALSESQQWRPLLDFEVPPPEEKKKKK